MANPNNVDGSLPNRAFRSMNRKTASFMKFMNQIGGDRQPEAHVQSHETEMRRAQDWRTEIQSLAKGIRAIVELLDSLGLMDLAWEAEFKGTATSTGEEAPSDLHDWYTTINSSVGTMKLSVNQLEAFLRTDHPTLHLLADLIYENKHDLKASIAAVAAAAITDHGALTGLLDDDHTQYPLKSILTTKGDIWAATAASTPARLQVGSNIRAIVADNASTTGVKYGGGVNQHYFVGTGSLDIRIDGANAQAALSTLTVTLGRLYLYPFWLKRPVTIDRIGYEVTTGSGLGGVVRIGIYASSSETDPKPAALILDSGEFSAADVETIGWKEKTASTAIAAPGLYWMAFIAGTSAPGVRALAPGAIIPLLGQDAAGNTRNAGLLVIAAYGALPSPFAGTFTTRSAGMPQVGVRISSAS